MCSKVIERIKQILRSYDLKTNGNVSDFARRIGCEQTTVNNQILGKRKLSLDTVMHILDTFQQVSAEWLLRGEGNMLIAEKPKQSTTVEAEIDYANICKQMANMYAEIQKLRAENAFLKAKKVEVVA